MRGTIHGERNPNTPAPNATMRFTFTPETHPYSFPLFPRFGSRAHPQAVLSAAGTRTRKRMTRPPEGLTLLPRERLNPDRRSLRRREAFGGIPPLHRYLEQAIASRDDDDATRCGISICALGSRRTAFVADHHVHGAAIRSQRRRRNRGDEIPERIRIDHVSDHSRTVLA